MTLKEIIEKMNSEIQNVPMEKRNNWLTGKTSFLSRLADTLLVHSPDAVAALDKHKMTASVMWSYGEPLPTLEICTSLRDDNPYMAVKSKGATSSSPVIRFTRRKKKISETREALVIDRAELSEWVNFYKTLEEFYDSRFDMIERSCQQVIQNVKKIDDLISVAGRDAVSDAFNAARGLSSISHLSFVSYFGCDDMILDDEVRKRILALAK